MVRILNWQKKFDKWKEENDKITNEINRLNQSLFTEIDELRDKLNRAGL